MVRSLATAVVLFALPSLAQGALNFEIANPGGQWTPGAGWGTDANENNGTLLGATFAINGNLANYPFALDLNNSAAFRFGTITLTEPNSHGGIRPSETDALGITATLTFLSPPGVGNVTATSVAITGSVSDSATDVRIDFAPTVVSFGSFGQFTVNLGEGTSSTAPSNWSTDVTLNGNPNDTVAYVWAQVTLDHLDSPDVTINPEPGSLLVWGGLGLMGLVFARRRRSKVV